MVAAYGILAGILLVLCLVVSILRFAKISLNQKNQLGMVMGTGCTALFLIETVSFILENLGGVGNMGTTVHSLEQEDQVCEHLISCSDYYSVSADIRRQRRNR